MSATVPPLLEREPELAALRAHLAAAVAGRGRLVVVEGPAGIGKTELLAAARSLATGAGAVWLAARGGELESAFPYGLVRQLFEGHLRTIPDDERSRLLAGATALAAPVLGAEVGSAPAQQPAFPVLHGLYWLCAGMAERRPLVLAVDDLHWGDEASLRFLAYLARRLEDLAVLLLVAGRPPVATPHASLVEALAGDPDAARLLPAPLGPSAVRSLVASSFGEAPGQGFVQAFHRVTAGNPFLCTALAGALAEEGVRPTDEAAKAIGRAAGGGLGSVLLRRLGALPPPARALAQAVAILGADVEIRLAASLAGLGAEEAVAATDALAALGLLRSELPLEFVHPLVREAIRESLPPGERASAHARAARLLADDGREPAAVAVHLLAAPPSAEAWAVERLREAARRAAAQGDPVMATTYLRRALVEPPRSSVRAQVLQELGVAEFHAGEVEAAVRDLGAAWELETDALRRALVDRHLGFALFQLGRFADAVDVQGRGMREATGRDPDLGACLEAERHQTAMMDSATYAVVGDLLDVVAPPSATTVGARALTVARAVEAAFRMEGDAAAAADRASQAFGQGLLDDLASSPTGLGVIAALPLVFADRFEEARRVGAAMIDDARRRGAPVSAVRAHLVRGLVRLAGGDVRGAEEDAAIAWELGREERLPPARMALGVLVEALVERGAYDEADGLLEDAGRAGPIPMTLVDCWPLYARARLRLGQGRLEEAVVDLEEIGRRGEACWRPWNPSILGYRSQLAAACVTSGDESRAAALAGEELRLARSWGAPRAIGIALRALGMTRRGDRAIDSLSESARVLEGCGARLEHARSLVALGAAVRRKGARREARAPLEAAMGIAHACGAAALAAQALVELRAAGARPRRTARTGVDALTPSELRVARMAADGMGNREIAQALFVTQRTIEVHLTSTYRKLGIAARRELGGALGVGYADFSPGDGR